MSLFSFGTDKKTVIIIRDILVHGTPEGNEKPTSHDSSHGYLSAIELFEKPEYCENSGSKNNDNPY